jgi:hypothetical protein
LSDETQAIHAHQHYPDGYWTRSHPEPVVLDIGGDVGALVLYTAPSLHRREIEVSPLGPDTQRIHTAVLERSLNGRPIFAAVYAELKAGTYRIWGDDASLVNQVTIVGGSIAEVDWR